MLENSAFPHVFIGLLNIRQTVYFMLQLDDFSRSSSSMRIVIVPVLAMLQLPEMEVVQHGPVNEM